MSSSPLFSPSTLTYIYYGFIIQSIIVAILLLVVNAPYGKFSSSSFGRCGPLLPPRWGWLIMESPAFYCSIITFFTFSDPSRKSSISHLFLLSLFAFHYFHRSFIYSFRLTSRTPMPFSVVFLAFIFCFFNGSLQGIYLSTWHPISTQEGKENTLSLTNIVGGIIFLIGFAINFHSDSILFSLKKKSTASINKKKDKDSQSDEFISSSSYVIPTGGLYSYVSAANYFGEIVEWGGFAIASSLSPPSIAFFFFTAANLIPRAMASHKWYQDKFKNYPKERKAVIPFIL